MKLTWKEKRMIESTMEGQILAHPNGINTRTLITNVQNILSNTIPNMNRYHIAGMIAWVLPQYGHQLIVRTSGYSVIQ